MGDGMGMSALLISPQLCNSVPVSHIMAGGPSACEQDFSPRGGDFGFFPLSLFSTLTFSLGLTEHFPVSSGSASQHSRALTCSMFTRQLASLLQCCYGDGMPKR